MHGEAHAGLDGHRFVKADQRPLNHVVPLAVGVEAKLTRQALLLLHEVVVGVGHVAAGGGAEQARRIVLRLLRRGKIIQLLRDALPSTMVRPTSVK